MEPSFLRRGWPRIPQHSLAIPFLSAAGAKANFHVEGWITLLFSSSWMGSFWDNFPWVRWTWETVQASYLPHCSLPQRQLQRQLVSAKGNSISGSHTAIVMKRVIFFKAFILWHWNRVKTDKVAVSVALLPLYPSRRGPFVPPPGLRFPLLGTGGEETKGRQSWGR